jgi:hypothetical protein
MMPHPGRGRGRRWPEIIDGWVRNPAIRRDGIRVLAMLLTCIVVALVILTCSGQLMTLWHWTLATLPGRVFGGCVVGTVLTWIGFRQVRRNRRPSALECHARTQGAQIHQEDNNHTDEGRGVVRERPPTSDNDEP